MKYIAMFGLMLLLASCNKGNGDLSNLSETVIVRTNGADMPVHVHGNMNSNVIIFLIHGGPGGNGLEYRAGNYSAELEKKYAVAYWDQRGQGMAQGHYTKEDITIETMVEDMDAVVKVLKAKYGENKSIFVMGHSWGGTLSAKYMITKDYQTHVKGWIEVDGAHDIPKLNRDAVAMYIAEANTQIALGNNVANWQGILDWANAIDVNNITEAQGGEINSNGNKVAGWLQQDGFIYPSDRGGHQNVTGQINPLTSLLSGNYTNQELLEIEQLSLTNELYKVTIPTLVLWGKYDFVVPPSLGQDTYDNVGSAVKKFVLFDKSAHSPMDNEWEKYVEEVSTFIDANK